MGPATLKFIDYNVAMTFILIIIIIIIIPEGIIDKAIDQWQTRLHARINISNIL